MSKKRTMTFITIIIVLALLLVGKTYVDDLRAPISKADAKKKTVTIPSGSGTRGIAKILKKNNLIKNEFVFNAYSKIENRNGNYKAGIYNLDQSMSQEVIMKQLEKGGTLKTSTKLTIPEGFELKQIADRLAKAGLVEKKDFLALTSDVSYFKDDYDFLKGVPDGHTLEGYLYPSTYEIFTDATDEDIVRKMLDGFKEVYTTEIEQKGKSLNMTTDQVIILASIIEREAVVEKERNTMSAVFHNRLKISMPLQSCATVQYALGERKQVLSNKDVQIKSDYNTYVNAGLPPAPISSPGIHSITAAVSPEDVDYLFFVRTGDDGSHTFSKSYNEHLKAKNRE